mgnify:CR=1 FL=1
MPDVTLNCRGGYGDIPAKEIPKLCFVFLFSFNLMLKIFKVIDFIYLINALKKNKIFT